MKTRPIPKPPSQEGVVPVCKRQNRAECIFISSGATSENRRVPSGRLSLLLTSSIDLIGPKPLFLISWVTDGNNNKLNTNKPFLIRAKLLRLRLPSLLFDIEKSIQTIEK